MRVSSGLIMVIGFQRIFALNNACHTCRSLPSSTARAYHAASSLQSSANIVYNVCDVTLCAALRPAAQKSWVTLSSTLRSTSATSLLIARAAGKMSEHLSFERLDTYQIFLSMTCDRFDVLGPALENPGTICISEGAVLAGSG